LRAGPSGFAAHRTNTLRPIKGRIRVPLQQSRKKWSMSACSLSLQTE
jgi:hypothetical protein